MRNRREFLAAALGGVAAALRAEGSDQKTEKAEKKSLDLAQARAFVKEARADLARENLEGAKLHELPACCIDGRHEGADCAIPGGDEGLMANTLAALNRLKVTDGAAKHKALTELVHFRGGPTNIRFHTDTHAVEHPKKYDLAEGCGHFRLSAEKPEEYHLAPADIDLIFSRLQELHQAGATQDVLKGDHEESAVMVVDDERITLKHKTSVGQAFIYSRALHHKMLKDFADRLAKAINLDRQALENQLLQAAHGQLMATCQKLAAGKPIYYVTLGEQNEEIVNETRHGH